MKLIPFYDGTGPRTSANGALDSQGRESHNLPPPAMFSETCSLPTPGCGQCVGDVEQQKIKSLLKLKKGNKTKLTENPEQQELWRTSTLPNPKNRMYSSAKTRKINNFNGEKEGSRV